MYSFLYYSTIIIFRYVSVSFTFLCACECAHNWDLWSPGVGVDDRLQWRCWRPHGVGSVVALWGLRTSGLLNVACATWASMGLNGHHQREMSFNVQYASSLLTPPIHRLNDSTSRKRTHKSRSVFQIWREDTGWDTSATPSQCLPPRSPNWVKWRPTTCQRKPARTAGLKIPMAMANSVGDWSHTPFWCWKTHLAAVLCNRYHWYHHAFFSRPSFIRKALQEDVGYDITSKALATGSSRSEVSPFLHDHVVEPSKFGNGMILAAADRSCPIHEAHFWRSSLSARLFRPEALHALVSLVACWSCWYFLHFWFGLFGCDGCLWKLLMTNAACRRPQVYISGCKGKNGICENLNLEAGSEFVWFLLFLTDYSGQRQDSWSLRVKDMLLVLSLRCLFPLAAGPFTSAARK